MPELCECGRKIDGSRTLAASAYEKCSRCRRKPRVRRTQILPPGLSSRNNVMREVLNKMEELEAEKLGQTTAADFENPWRTLEQWIESQINGE